MDLLETQVQKVNVFILEVKDQKVIVVRLVLPGFLQLLAKRAKREKEEMMDLQERHTLVASVACLVLPAVTDLPDLMDFLVFQVKNKQFKNSANSSVLKKTSNLLVSTIYLQQ